MKQKEFYAPVLGARRYAAIDVGSNSVHMLIAQVVDGHDWQPVVSMKESVRLAEALGDGLMLDAQAVAKLTPVLKEMAEKASSLQAPVTAYATQACREAKNGREFCFKIRKRTGVKVQIISGNEEARLVYLGVQKGIAVQKNCVFLVDIGGGSTEILVGQWGEERFSTSLKLGAVRLTQRYLNQDPWKQSDLGTLRSYVETRLEPVLWEIKRIGFDLAVATSGTAKAVKLVSCALQGLPWRDLDVNGLALSVSELNAVVDLLIRNPYLKDRRLILGLDPKRAEILLAGALVLQCISRQAGVNEWTLSNFGLREGMLQDLIARDQLWKFGSLADVRWRSVRDFSVRNRVDQKSSWHLTSLAVSLFTQLQDFHGLSDEWREYLRTASLLCETGRVISYTGYHRHSCYLIKNSEILGFTQEELYIISTIVRFHRKRGLKIADDFCAHVLPNEEKAVRIVSGLLRLASCLDAGKQGKIRALHVRKCGPNAVHISFILGENQDIFLEMQRCLEEMSEIESALELKVVLGVAQAGVP